MLPDGILQYTYLMFIFDDAGEAYLEQVGRAMRPDGTVQVRQRPIQ